MIRRRFASSRLRRTSDKQNKKQAFLFTFGIIILIIVLIQFGPLLINLFGNVVYTLRGGDNSDTTKVVGNTVIQAPVLFDIPQATQSSHIMFRGTTAENKGTVEIYVNGDLEDEIDLKDTNFEVKNLQITKGNNTIKARISRDGITSPFSEEYQVSYIADKPNLDVSFPSDGASFTKADKSITIIGKTDTDNDVYVNSFKAIVEPNGEFSYLLQLNEGDNQITIEAKNPAGVSTQKQLKVTYHP